MRALLFGSFLRAEVGAEVWKPIPQDGTIKIYSVWGNTRARRERRTPTKSSTPCCFIASGYLRSKVLGALVKQNAASQPSNILALKSPFKETFPLCVRDNLICASPVDFGLRSLLRVNYWERKLNWILKWFISMQLHKLLLNFTIWKLDSEFFLKINSFIQVHWYW